MEGYVPIKGDIVWLGNDIKPNKPIYSPYRTPYVVIDIVYLKNKKTLIRVKNNNYRGWFDVEKVYDYFREASLEPIVIQNPTPHLTIQDPILLEFLEADYEYNKYMKEIMNIS